MKKLVPSILYGATAIAMLFYFDFVIGVGPLTRHRSMFYAAALGALLLLAGSAMGAFGVRWATASSMFGVALCWPQFVLMLRSIPWLDVSWSLRYRRETSAAVFLLVCCLLYFFRLMWRQSRRESSERGHT